jgi:hypothetical protein
MQAGQLTPKLEVLFYVQEGENLACLFLNLL